MTPEQKLKALVYYLSWQINAKFECIKPATEFYHMANIKYVEKLNPLTNLPWTF